MDGKPLLTSQDIAELQSRHKGQWDPNLASSVICWLVESRRGERVLTNLAALAIRNKMRIAEMACDHSAYT